MRNRPHNPDDEGERKTHSQLPPSITTGDFRDKAYVEAGEWVRLTNTIVWAIGGLVLPICAGALGFGIKEVQYLSLIHI